MTATWWIVACLGCAAAGFGFSTWLNRQYLESLPPSALDALLREHADKMSKGAEPDAGGAP